jgi:hypothetical protein
MLTQAHGKVLNEGVVGVGVDLELGSRLLARS